MRWGGGFIHSSHFTSILMVENLWKDYWTWSKTKHVEKNHVYPYCSLSVTRQRHFSFVEKDLWSLKKEKYPRLLPVTIVRSIWWIQKAHILPVLIFSIRWKNNGLNPNSFSYMSLLYFNFISIHPTKKKKLDLVLDFSI